MAYYIFPSLVWLSFCIWRAHYYATARLRLFHYIFAFPLIFLAALRGDVGTDTTTYTQSAQYVIWWGLHRSINMEPGYVALVWILSFITSDPRFIVNIISLISAVLFFSMLYKLENGQCIYSLLFIPICYFDFTMNGLRMGIAFPLAVFAILMLEKKRFALFYAFGIAAISIQMTAALLVPMLLLARRGPTLSIRGFLYVALSGFLTFVPAYYIFRSRIAVKLIVYAATSSPTTLSGLGPLILSCFAALFAIWACEKKHRYLGCTFLVIQLLFYWVTTYSYAGIRFQEMALFAQLVALSSWAIRPVGRKQLAVIVLFFCLAFGWKTRDFVMTSGEPSAFIPYHFVWEDL